MSARSKLATTTVHLPILLLCILLLVCAGDSVQVGSYQRQPGLVHVGGEPADDVSEAVERYGVEDCALTCAESRCAALAVEVTTGRCDLAAEPWALPAGSWLLYHTTDTEDTPDLVTLVPLVRRQDGSVDFDRPWADYRSGFGDGSRVAGGPGEFWLGLKRLHQITGGGSYGLRAEMATWGGQRFWAEYAHFSAGPELDGYRLDVSGYNPLSTAGDSLTNGYYGNHRGVQFSTYERDNDRWGANCAASFHGGWWYTDCLYSKPTGLFLGPGNVTQTGIAWYSVYGNMTSFKYMELLLVQQ